MLSKARMMKPILPKSNVNCCSQRKVTQPRTLQNKTIKQNQKKKNPQHTSIFPKEWFGNTSVTPKDHSLIVICMPKRNLFPKQELVKVCSISEILLEIREAGIIFSAAERPGIFQAISQSLLLYHVGHKPTNYERTQISIVFSSDIHYPSSEKINTCMQKLNKVSLELKV